MKKKTTWIAVVALLLTTTGIMLSKFFRPQEPSNGSGPKAVYLVMRSEYEVPVGHRVLKFDDPGLLAWFRNHWGDASLEEQDVPYNILSAMEKWGSIAPGNLEALKKFAASIYNEQGILFDEHAIQCFHDDDEIDTPWYFFDDVFAARHPERVSYLMREDWRLPEEAAGEGLKLEDPQIKQQVTPGTGEGCVYGVFLSALDGATISDITGNFRFDGVRIPGFAGYLAQGKSPLKKSWGGEGRTLWPEELLLLRSLILKSGETSSLDGFLGGVSPADLAHRFAEVRTFSDFRYGLRQSAAGKKPGKSMAEVPVVEDPRHFLEGDAAACETDWGVFQRHLAELEEKRKTSAWSHIIREPMVQASPHLCQIRLVEQASMSGKPQQPTTWAYIFFDDLWLAANLELGESILRYGSGANVLGVGEELER